ncbi:MAG: conjugal transfer protein TraH [Holosporaceae bacterium]|jgi:conjugative transfer pilus assembly protein TraH|nr:conjugal transfer protein TraH [Holosporaceae bacterium]
MKKTLYFLMFFVCENVLGGIGADLENFFNKFGTGSNITAPGVHQDQSAGYYSGGGISLKNRTKNAQLATLQLPSFKAGCGGIDMFLGGFSHISSQQLVQTLKAIGTNAATYAFKLAVKTVAPMVETAMAELENIASKINQANINSCETAATLLGGILPKSDLTSRHLCTSMGTSSNMFKDWAAARQGCGAGPERSSTMARKNDLQDYKDILFDEFNVAWEVIRRNDSLRSDTELAQLCMTLSGTIVAFKEGEKRRILTYPSKADDNNLIKALFEGGETIIYACAGNNKEKCLNVERRKHTIPAAKTFMIKVREILKSITDKAKEDKALSPQEIAFIGSVRLPIYKMVNVLATYKRTEFDLRDFTDIISVDFIHQYITEVLDLMLQEVANLRSAQVSDEEISQFIAQLQHAKHNINQKRKMAYEQMNQMLIVIESVRIYERKLEGSFEALQKGGK